MYEQQTYDAILTRMLSRVPDEMDKRAGSIIYDALAPAAVELAQLYMQLDLQNELVYADSATGTYLSRRTAEFGIQRRSATHAKRKGVFRNAQQQPVDVPLGSRFSIATYLYVVMERIQTGEYVLRCETAGAVGNQHYGALLPVDYINGLARAELTDLIVPGEDAETDAHLRERYYEAVNRPAFGGNVADYKQKISAMAGVGDVKVVPVWEGGGTVKVTVIAGDWQTPSAGLIEQIQQAVDPVEHGGTGMGIAPIGHRVTIGPTVAVPMHVATTLTLAQDVTPSSIQQPIEEAVAGYLTGLCQQWAREDRLIVRIALLDAAMLLVPGVIDVQDTALNGAGENVTLDPEQIPVLGTVTLA